MKDPRTNANLYVGSSIDIRTRKLYHCNPNSPNHGSFGKWLHKEGLADTVVMKVLESVVHSDREELKKLCRQREFQWKKKIPCKFCDVYDGLCLQEPEVQREHRREIRKRHNAYAREYYKRTHVGARKIQRNKVARAAHARRRLQKDGVVVKHREMGLSREEKLAKRRKRYAERKLREGKVIKARGRVPKPSRKNSVNNKKQRHGHAC